MDYPNVLFCSLDAALIGEVARQVASEGHDVRYYIERPGDREIADGFVEKTDDWRADLGWADLVVFDDIWIAGGDRGERPETSERGEAPRAGDEVGTGELAEELRAEGIPVVGGTTNTDRLEADRGYAMDVLEANGVEVLPHRVFQDFGAAREYVREHPAPYVIKPLGEVQNVKRLLYVGREADGGDVIDVLAAYERAWGDRMEGFQLQRRAEGVEVAVCGFFDGEDFVEPINVNFEHKKLFPGNLGPQTGEMGTSMFWSERNSLFEATLGTVEDWLADEGYVGSIDVNCIANAEGIYPLEFTPRFGYPTITVQTAGMESPVGQFLYGLATDADPDLRVHRGYQVGVRVVVPPFPYDDEATYDETSRDAAIVFETDDRNGVHIEDAKRVDGQWRVAGDAGMPLVVTGRGETMAAAREEVYGRLDSIIVPTMYYRDDIGERWIDGDGDRLGAWGYV